MALGTVPIITPDVNMSSYANPPIENIHYFKVQNPEQITQVIQSVSEKQWTQLSLNCINWYRSNVHSVVSANRTLENIFGFTNTQFRFGTNYSAFNYSKKITQLSSDCVIYCVGAGEDILHDVELAKLTKSKVHIFDPTPRAINHVKYVKDILNGSEPFDSNRFGGGDKEYNNKIINTNLDPTQIEIHEYGVHVTNDESMKFYVPDNNNFVSHSLECEMRKTNDFINVKVRTIDKCMQLLNHTHIDLLKIDIEGSEIKVLEHMFSKNIYPTFISVDFDLIREKMNAEYSSKYYNLLNFIFSLGYIITFFDDYDVTFERIVNRNVYDETCYIPTNTYLERSNNEISQLIDSNKPFSVVRFGMGPETFVSYEYLQTGKLNYGLLDSKGNMPNAGIYTKNKDLSYIELYCRYYNSSIKNSNTLAGFENHELLSKIQTYYTNLFNINQIHSRSLEPVYAMLENKNTIPWTYKLKGKKVLIINSFIDSIKKQLDNKFCYNKPLFLEKQEFLFYKTFQTVNNNFVHDNWFETYNIMKNDIQKLEFDIALVACGGYGVPLCNFIKEELNKSAIYIGGGLQMMFGVLGQRWSSRDDWKTIIKNNKCNFIYPTEHEIIKGCENSDCSSYWSKDPPNIMQHESNLNENIQKYKIIEFRLLTINDEYDLEYKYWSRIYEYPIVKSFLLKLGAHKSSYIHNSCWGSEDHSCSAVHIMFKQYLEKKYSNVIHSDIKSSTLKNTIVYDVTTEPPVSFVNSFDFVINISTIEEINIPNEIIFKHLLKMVKQGGYLIVTFDYRKDVSGYIYNSIDIRALETMFNTKLKITEQCISGMNSRICEPNNINLNCGIFVIQKL